MQSSNRLCVLGLNRLGLCLSLCLQKAGYEVVGFDPSWDNALDSFEPKVNAWLKECSRFRKVASLEEALEWSDLCFIAVPTAMEDQADLIHLLQKIYSLGVEHKHLVISSTLFPGFTSQIAKPLFADRAGITISYNPTFIAQGAIIDGLTHPDLVLIGEDHPAIGKRLEEIHWTLCENTPHIARMSVASAEIAKLAVSCFVTAKIAFANLMGEIADETAGADKRDILAAIGKDRRIGSECLKPGFGFGGPGFPKENRALGSYALQQGIDPLLFRATDQVNAMHAEWMAAKLIEKNLPEYVFEDVCYKPNCPVPITEQSQKLAVAKRLAEQGRKVTILDTEGVLVKVQQEFHNMFNYSPKPTNAV